MIYSLRTNHKEVSTLQDLTVPVIAIDGPSSSGKGTVATIIARELGFHHLDSGILYRIIAWRKQQEKLTMTEQLERVAFSLHLYLEVKDGNVYYDGRNCTLDIRSKEVSELSKDVSQIPEVRELVRQYQFACRKTPGLVAEGRDMGVIFLDPSIRFFLDATLAERARRRTKQYLGFGWSADYDEIYESLRQRDYADRTREHSKFEEHPEAEQIDTTNTSAEEVARRIISQFREQRPRVMAAVATR